MNRKKLIYGLTAIAAFTVLVGAYAGYVYASTPAHLRQPAFQHYHFRTQILVDGEPVKFSAEQFQQEYDSSSCSTDISGVPIDFHDNADQMTHVHWDGMTGGEFLKDFGWNFIGGDDDSLGYRYDKSKVRPHKVKIFGKHLPALPDKAKFYIYTGDTKGYERKDWSNFLSQDLEVFFGKQSSLGEQAAGLNILAWLFPKASAHGGEIEIHDESDQKKSEEELTRINNLIGNVVIFVQEREPTNEQIQERFNNLAPLHDSTCGG